MASTLDGFIWCPHCGSPHGLQSKFCPHTGKAMTTTAGTKAAAAAAAAASTATAPTSEHIGVGTIINKKYHVVGLIGRGGQSIVYEALHTALGQRVALKFLAKEPDKKALQRFEQEARLAATIAHPHVCRSYDLGTLKSGTRFIVMERLQGESLQAMLRRQTLLEPKLALHLGSQVLLALAAAHAANVAHRDIKPGNVFVELVPGTQPNAKVLDFGLAKVFAGAKSAIGTTIGHRLGTPAYMSPEQLSGKPIDGRSDLFSLGVLLYEMLTGSRPFEGNSGADVMAGILRDVPAPLHVRRPELSKELDAIIQRALAKDPEDRFRSADEMRRALRNAPRHRRAAAPVAAVAERLPSFADDDSSES
jgi:serine/threonine protein kinase